MISSSMFTKISSKNVTFPKIINWKFDYFNEQDAFPDEADAFIDKYTVNVNRKEVFIWKNIT